jgi:cysteine desulfurase
VALKAANQEVGTRQPTDDLDLPARVPLLVDVAAAVGRGPLPRRWAALTASAHQWGGPPGVGVLAVRRGTRWTSPFPGEDVLDAVDNVPGALAAAAALQDAVAEQDAVAARQRGLVDRIRSAAAALPDTEVVGDPVDRLPHLVTFSVLYVAGDELVNALDRRGFGVASGSACTASTLTPSHVLAAMGALTHGNVRVSLARDTEEDEVEAFCRALTDAVTEIRKEAGL